MVFRELVARHAVAAYVALTFLVSWGGLLLVGGPAGSTGTAWQTDARLPLMIIAMLAGPSLAGLLLTGLTGGRDALRGLWHRLTTWHVAVRWYAVALLTAPTVFAIVHLVLSRRSPGLLPSLGAGVAWRGVLAGAIAALGVGLCEEVGWTGFATPMLRHRHGVFAAGVLIGVPWGAWHLLTNDVWIVSGFAGTLPPALFIILNGLALVAGQLPAYRFGRVIRLKEEEVDAFIESCRIAPGTLEHLYPETLSDTSITEHSRM